jgi:predicted acylesterase/phospholipase RssA
VAGTSAGAINAAAVAAVRESPIKGSAQEVLKVSTGRSQLAICSA